MITEEDLQAAIAECQGQRNPNAQTCIKLAAFLTIKEYLYGKQTDDFSLNLPTYSYTAEPVENLIDYQSDTEFSAVINGRRAKDVWPVIDELMEILKATSPRLYKGVLRKIQD